MQRQIFWKYMYPHLLPLIFKVRENLEVIVILREKFSDSKNGILCLYGMILMMIHH